MKRLLLALVLIGTCSLVGSAEQPRPTYTFRISLEFDADDQKEILAKSQLGARLRALDDVLVVPKDSERVDFRIMCLMITIPPDPVYVLSTIVTKDASTDDGLVNDFVCQSLQSSVETEELCTSSIAIFDANVLQPRREIRNDLLSFAVERQARKNDIATSSTK